MHGEALIWATISATMKSATTSRGCGATGKRSATRWQPSAASMQSFRPKVIRGSGPKIAAALTSNHHCLVINCDSCGTVIDLDLRVKPRDPEADKVYRDLNFCHRLGSAISLSVVGPSHPVVVPLRVAQAGRRGFSDPRSFLAFSLSAACLKFCQTHVTTVLQEWPAFRFRAAPPGDDPTLIDRVAA